MNDFFDYIKKWFATFVAVAATVGFIAVFGDINEVITLGQATIVSLFTITIIAFVWHFTSQKGKVYKHISREKITNRSGYQISKEVKHSDSIHKFELIHRRDYLNIGTGNYFSIRHLRGRNVSRKESDGIVYYEGMDIKTKFSNVQFEALDVRTGKKLTAKNCSGNNDSKFFFVFKIFFETPINPQESFDIQFSIFIKDEVKHLSDEDEFMSVSLRRCKKGVENLVFDIALSIHPNHRCCFKENIFGEAVFVKNTVEDKGELTKDNDEFKILSNSWFKRGFTCLKSEKASSLETTKLYLFSFKQRRPQKTVYAIHFMNDIEG